MTDCLFCKIIDKQIPAKIEFENETVLAMHDINPQAPHHLLILPKKHIEKISDLQTSDSTLMGSVIECAKEVAAKKGLDDYRLIFNNGRGAGQSVFHIHLHLLAGRTMNWPPG